MTDLKLGRLAATRPFGVRNLTAYATTRLPLPPASVGVPNASYPMDGNDQYGDCTIAGVAHLLAAWNAEVDESDPVPNQTEVVNQYFTLTGGPDTGLNEHNVLETWRTAGLWGNKIDAYVPVDPKDLTELHQAVAFYGGVYLGVAVPQSAQQQFQAGKPWTVVPGSPVLGGHCIVGLGYSPHGLLCATWGGVAEVTYPWLTAYLEEAWAVIPQQFVEAERGPRLDLSALRSDLGQI